MKKLLILTILAFVPLPIFADEEQNVENKFQQYIQEDVKSTVNSYDDGFMNYMMYPYFFGHFGGYGHHSYLRHGYNDHHFKYKSSHNNHHYDKHRDYNYNNSFTYFGPDFWNNRNYNNQYTEIKNTTFVPSEEYSFNFSGQQK